MVAVVGGFGFRFLSFEFLLRALKGEFLEAFEALS